MKSTSITYRIIALTMAFLMFFTSVGFTVDMHYCQGKLKTFNFFGKAKSCHEVGEGMKDCPFHAQMNETNKVIEHRIATFLFLILDKSTHGFQVKLKRQ